MLGARDHGRLSAPAYESRQRWVQILGGALLILAALIYCLLLASGMAERLPVVGAFPLPLLVLLAVAGLLAAIGIWRRPLAAVYLLVVAAILFEQWPIEGITTLTEKPRFFQTISGAWRIPIPVPVAELVLFLAFAAVLLPRTAGFSARFFRGSLFTPIMLFLGAVGVTLVYGAVNTAAGPYVLNAAWQEARGFVYLILMYFLVANLITTRTRLEVCLWAIILATAIKGVQGAARYVSVTRQGIHLEAVTGHEDVIFFTTFFVLLAALLIYGGPSAQRRGMLWLLAPVLFTEFATTRRIAFFILPAGLLIVGLSLLHDRRALFFKTVPLVLALLTVYGAVFWNRPDGLLGQPIRAVRSQIGLANERDKASDAFRVAEDTNIERNIESAPFTGLGFGRPYTLYVPQTDLTSIFPYWRYMTHNAVFWVWLKMGLFGFVAFWFLIGSAVIQGLVSFRTLSDGYLRAIAITVVAVILMQVLFSYGDLGLTYSRPTIFLGAMLGLVVRLPDIERDPLGEGAA